ncbi:GMC oxidoreductase [Pollutimonas nitritireducens]|uniref:GMC oxidoreductase n=1 Tax=Pollutimonas nitritireducens TaxID=2045209 RepID=UPI0018EE07BA|nr:GMC oxidoreductase [Pollutimonas nitritireducens]
MEDENQWEWMVGRNYHALRNMDAVSPKLRAPTHASVFEKFNLFNKIEPNDFVVVGSLAQGGLSNAWGCGVARLSVEELRHFPFASSEIEQSYATVTRRIGVSGGIDDDLSQYFGLDQWASPPIQMDNLQSSLLDRYVKRRSKVTSLGMRLGHSRVAALSESIGDRHACDLSGNCLWGCDRRALYAATEDLRLLIRYANFTYKSGFIVEKIIYTEGNPAIFGTDITGKRIFNAKKVILAAGTIATTKLALQALNFEKPVAMHSCPTAAFMLWLPAALGKQRESAFGLGQLSFVLSLPGEISGFGSLFNPTGISVAEFLRYLPLRKRYGIDFLSALLSSCVVGNIFLPGNLTTATLSLKANNYLNIEGRYSQKVSSLMHLSEKRLRKAFWKLGAVLLPKSFTLGKPGSDIHYACSLPMREAPTVGETNADGALFGIRGIYIADGASLPILTEKSHTLTIMANADRIARKLAQNIALSGGHF